MFGDLSWGRSSRGVLSRKERFEFVMGGVRAEIGQRLRALSGAKTSGHSLNVDDIKQPDSAMAKHAEALCREGSPDYLLNHCYRTYFWGALLGQRDGRRYDSEVLYVASLLHDLGHTQSGRSGPHQCCFAVSGAEAAMEAMTEFGCPAHQCHQVADAIALHMNLAPTPESKGPEARLLQSGAAFDVVGTRYRDVPNAAVHDVLSRYPRLDFKQRFGSLMHEEAKSRPGTRVSVMDKTLGLRQRIRQSPFAE